MDEINYQKDTIERALDGWVAETSQHAHEYAVLTLRSLLLVSGGGLLAIPALAGISEDFKPEIGRYSAGLFALTVLMCILCSYFAFWYYSVVHERSTLIRDHYMSLSRSASTYGSSHEAVWNSQDQRLQRRAMGYFRFAHGTGIAGILFFVAGAALLFLSFDFGQRG
jgi:hypothetical protein